VAAGGRLTAFPPAPLYICHLSPGKDNSRQVWGLRNVFFIVFIIFLFPGGCCSSYCCWGFSTCLLGSYGSHCFSDASTALRVAMKATIFSSSRLFGAPASTSIGGTLTAFWVAMGAIIFSSFCCYCAPPFTSFGKFWPEVQYYTKKIVTTKINLKTQKKGKI
jgi:hypothetical protein